MEKNIFVPLILLLIVLAAACIMLLQEPQPVACTEEALICPDGSAVGRIAPYCRFAPCPNCTCPEGYLREGATCNLPCYYNTPRCLAPSMGCNSTTP